MTFLAVIDFETSLLKFESILYPGFIVNYWESKEIAKYLNLGHFAFWKKPNQKN